MTSPRIEPRGELPAPRAAVRPTAIVRAAIKTIAGLGLMVEVRPDGTVIGRQSSPQSTEPPVAKSKGVVL